MGVAPSQLAVQERFNALSSGPEVTQDDDIWETLLSGTSCCLKLTDKEFYGMITSEDIRRIFVGKPGNFRMLFTKTLERLAGLMKSAVVGTNGAVSLQISNCCRIVTRLVPIIYECEAQEEYHELLRNAINLLRNLIHYRGYTVPLSPKSSVVWTKGVGCPVNDGDVYKYTQQRCIVIRALLCILSTPLYSNTDAELEYFTTTMKDPAVLCSLLNTAISKTNTEVGTLSMDLLVITLTHMAKGKNQFRKFMAKLRRREDLDWLLAQLKQHHESTEEQGMSAILIWEIVQANHEFASSGSSLVELAKLLCDEVCLHIDQPGHSHGIRLRCLVLLSITANNSFCAQAIAPEVLELVLKHRSKLNSPSIEMAALVDVLANCAPSLRVTDTEAQKLRDLQDEATRMNSTTSDMINAIINIMQFLNPTLDNPSNPATQSSEWNPIQFRWDPTRFRWYQSVIWGHTYQNEPRIWARTHIQLFKVAELKPRGRAVEFVDKAASLLQG